MMRRRGQGGCHAITGDRVADDELKVFATLRGPSRTDDEALSLSANEINGRRQSDPTPDPVRAVIALPLDQV